jgi:pimeloyl-ACP methyl ester carboxylesterase
LAQWSVVVMLPSRLAAIALSAVVLSAGLAPAASAAPSSSPAARPACGDSGAVTTVNGSLPDGATYLMQCPAGPWNGTLFLYSHGYVVPGSANPAQDVGDPATGNWLLSHGFALAGSSYATTGWAIQQALPDQIGTLGVFGQAYGTPARTIAWGHSLGGIITAGLIQRYPDRFTAALPMCGVLSGGVATWNTALDAAFGFQQLVDPSVQLVNITSPGTNLAGAEAAAAAAQQTAAGRARLALAAALGDTPGWFTPLSREPAPGDAAGQEANQYQWDTQVDFPFIFAFRAELEARAGGNPSWNTGVNYDTQLLRSADLREVVALYHAAGLSLTADLNRLNHAQRISADPSAVSYMAQNIAFNGRLAVPVLTMHTTGDGLVVPENEQAYAEAAEHAGDSSMLRQIYVDRAGHCAFTPAETITAVQALLNRVDTGRWSQAGLEPATLNARAAALGPSDNIFVAGSAVTPAAPAFLRYRPAPYLRPFTLPTW